MVFSLVQDHSVTPIPKGSVEFSYLVMVVQSLKITSSITYEGQVSLLIIV